MQLLTWTRRSASRRWAVGALVAVLFGYLLAELVLRATCSDRLPSGAQPAIYATDDTYGYRYVADASSAMCIPGVCHPVTVNSAGLFGPHTAKERTPGTYRIAFVGSCEGTGLYLNSGLPHPQLLERLLREDGFEVEVYNFSIDGLFLDYERALIARDIVPEYAPDLVVLETNFLPFIQTNQRREVYRGYLLSWGADVPGAHEEVRRQIDFIESHGALIAWADLSYVPRALARWYGNHLNDWRVQYLRAFSLKRWAGQAVPTPLSTLKSLDLLLDIKARLARQGGELVQFGTLIHKLAVARGLRYVDIRYPLDPSSRNRFDSHTNEHGQRLVAEQLHAALKPYLVAAREAREKVLTHLPVAPLAEDWSAR